MMTHLKRYKVLDKGMTSPFRGHQYKLNVTYHCIDIDMSGEDCAKGFYATRLDGIMYSFSQENDVYEWEEDGDRPVQNEIRIYSYQTQNTRQRAKDTFEKRV